MRLAIFPPHLSKVLHLPRKSDARSYEVLHLSRKIISGNQRPDRLTALMNMSLVLRLPRKMHLCRSSSHAPRLPSFLEMLQNHHAMLTFDKVHNPLPLPRKTTLQRLKVARTRGALYILISKCASRHNGVHFFDISTSKSGLNVVCFVHFVLRTTTAGTTSTSQLPKMVRTWCGLYMLTWKCASCHNGVHFFDITTSRSGPNLVCFVHFDLEVCFAPQRRVIFHLSSGQLALHPPL